MVGLYLIFFPFSLFKYGFTEKDKRNELSLFKKKHILWIQFFCHIIPIIVLR